MQAAPECKRQRRDRLLAGVLAGVVCDLQRNGCQTLIGIRVSVAGVGKMTGKSALMVVVFLK